MNHPPTTANKLVACCVFCYVVVLTCLALSHADEPFLHLFSESGFFERCSVVLWVLAGTVLLARARPLTRPRIAIALLCFSCALREADWHKKFTADGIFKVRYFTHAQASLTEKLIAAVVVLFFGFLVVYVARSIYRSMRATKFRITSAHFITALGLFFFVISKILDRTASVLQKSLHIITSSEMKRFIIPYEEGLEMIAPLLFALSFFRRTPCPSEPTTAPLGSDL